MKKKWEVVLRMAMKSSKTSLVCSEHFLTSDFVKTKKCDYTYSLNILYCIYNIVYCLIVYSFIVIFNILLVSSPVKVKRLAKNVVPSQNLPIRSFDRPLDSPRKMKIIQRAERNTKRKLHFSL